MSGWGGALKEESAVTWPAVFVGTATLGRKWAIRHRIFRKRSW